MTRAVDVQGARARPAAMPTGPKLRARPLEKPLRIVLVEPEIPPNTGAIARTAAATASELHLVGKLGFSIDEHAVRRAGLDYWPLVSLHVHASWSDFVSTLPDPGRMHLMTSSAPKSVYGGGYEPGDSLVFGCESVGLSQELLDAYPEQHRAIPTLGPVRSLNLATAASLVTYEALRSLGALDHSFLADDAVGQG